MQSTLFIPDISGFTEFVKSTEIEHSKHIIEELIDIMVEGGSSLFEVSEIEGDAVFFYKTGHVETEEVMSVAKKIFTDFHKHLSRYETSRICNCGACLHAVDLKLKFIVHGGEIDFVKFEHQKKNKPFGDPVIAAHRLLKNDIDSEEYILLTDDYLANNQKQHDGSGGLKDNSLGDITFKYLEIEHWKNDMVTEPFRFKHEKVDLSIESSTTVSLESDKLYQLISDLQYRKHWNTEADDFVYDENTVNRVGTTHHCIINGKELTFDTIKPETETEGLVYGEILRNPEPFGYLESNFIITPVSTNESKIRLIFKVGLGRIFQFLFKSYYKKKVVKQATMLLNGIKKVIEDKDPILASL